MITIINSGMGNIASVQNMIRRIGGEAQLTTSPEEIRHASRLILPGIGSFDAGMAALEAAGFVGAIRDAVASGAVLLGICLGMQLLLDGSDEGTAPGLGLVPGRARKFGAGHPSLRVPHMGWNIVRPARPSRLFDPAADEQRFYFVHSFYAECADAADVAGTTDYGGTFVSAFERGRVMGVQFHPEKSHRFGMTLLQRFLES